MKRLGACAALASAALLCGCGEVIIFGHTVSGGHSTTEEQPAPASAPATTAAAPATAPAQPARAPAPAPPAAAPAPQPAPPPPAVSAVTAPRAPSAVPGPMSAAPPAVAIHNVIVAVDPGAQSAVAAEPRFNRDGLLSVVRRELTDRKLLEEHDGSCAGCELEVRISELAVEAKSNAVLFGYNLAEGTLGATATLRDGTGSVIRAIKVRTRNRLSIAADGPDSTALNALYRSFAQQLAEALVHPPSS